MQKLTLYTTLLILILSSNLLAQNLTLTIIGSSKKENKLLDSIGYLNNHKNYISLEKEVTKIKKRLARIGFIENETKSIIKTTDTTFTTQINLKNKFKELHVYYREARIEHSTIKRVSKKIFNDYFVVNFANIEFTMHSINNEVSKRGYPFNILQLTNIIKKDTSHLKASLKIVTATEKRTINNIIVKGYKKFPKSYLKHFLKIRKDQLFDLEAIKAKTENLKNLNFTNEIKPPEVLFSKDSTSLYLYLEKSQSNNFDGFLGFGTNDETNQIEFDGYLNLNLTNNLNLGESFRLLYKSDENDQKTFEVNASIPYLFKTPIGADILLRLFRRDTSFATTNQSLRLNYQVNSKTKIFAGITTTESTNLLTENPNPLISDYKTKHYTVAYQFLKPQNDNLLFPLKSKIYLESAVGNRETTLPSEKQSQITLNLLNIFNLNAKNSLYLNITGSHIISNNYFENELLRFGGINSIRGFEENSLLASLFSVLNTEYRYQLNNSIYVHSIFDAAYLENKTTESKKKLYGYGVGFSILTKSGLLKFNYANGKNENTSFKLNNSKIHISLIANF